MPPKNHELNPTGNKVLIRRLLMTRFGTVVVAFDGAEDDDDDEATAAGCDEVGGLDNRWLEFAELLAPASGVSIRLVAAAGPLTTLTCLPGECANPGAIS